MVSGSEISVVSFLYHFGAFVEADFGDLRHEGGMTAVVRPIGIEHAELGDRWFTVLFLKIFLSMKKIGGRHRETEFATKVLKFCLGFLIESLEDGDVFGLGGFGALIRRVN